MTDYKNLKLIASSSPHIRSNEDTRSIMLDVIIALLPALAWSVYAFGWKALLLTAVAIIFRKKIQDFALKHSEGRENPRRTAILTVATGAVLGVLVSISSVGAG